MIPLNTSLCYLGNVKGETGNISIDLTIDISILETPKESLLDHASENLLDAERTANMAHELGKHAAGAASLLGQAIGSLDQIVNIVDGIVEVWLVVRSQARANSKTSVDPSLMQGCLDAPFFRV